MESSVNLDEFVFLSKPKKRRCAVHEAWGKLTKEEQEQLTAACAVDRAIITAGGIATWLKARGFYIPQQTITSHRSHTCSCSHG